jgi:hypothetical protein
MITSNQAIVLMLLSGQNPLHNVPVNIGQAIAAALELVCQSLMIDAQQMHDRGVQIMDVQPV